MLVYPDEIYPFIVNDDDNLNNINLFQNNDFEDNNKEFFLSDNEAIGNYDDLDDKEADHINIVNTASNNSNSTSNDDEAAGNRRKEE
jgi:hypothetical protein